MNDPVQPIARVGVLGCGLIGASWTALFVAHGIDVTAYDPEPAARATFADAVARRRAVLRGVVPEPPREGGLGVTDSLAAAVGAADLVQENAPERASIKADLFREAQPRAPAQAIFASSTSSLVWSDIATTAPDPSRIIIAHPFNPPDLLRLVEIFGIDEAVVARATAFYERLGRVPVRIRREAPGHIANRLSSALYREAVHLVAAGIATTEDVDRALIHGPAPRWAAIGVHLGYHLGGGPGGIRHYLDHLGGSQERRWATLGTPQLDPALRERLAGDVLAMAGGRTIGELEAMRDALLIAIDQARGAGGAAQVSEREQSGG